MDHTNHKKKISRSTKASTVLAIPLMDHKKKISRSTKASTILATKLLIHVYKLFVWYFCTLVHCTLIPIHADPARSRAFLYLARFFSLHARFRRLNRLLVSSQILIPHPLRYHSPVKEPSLASSLSSLCVGGGAYLKVLTDHSK